jgi:aryl-alcohol dehydrogenase-like predicted oxidoreductase
MRDGETAREYADRLQRERREAAEARSQRYEALRGEQVQHDLKLTRQMAALAEQLLAYPQSQPPADSPIQGMSTVCALTAEVVNQIEALIRALEDQQ